MELSERTQDNALIIKPEGRIDVEGAGEFKIFMEKAVRGKNKIMIDLTMTDFINSSGFGILINAQRELKQKNGDIKLFGLKPPIKQLFHITRLNKVFDIFETEDDALKAF